MSKFKHRIMINKQFMLLFYLCILVNILKAQDFTGRWHYQVHSDKIVQASYCANPDKGILAAFRNTSKLQVEGKEWLSSANEKAVLASFDSFGQCLWQKPVIAAGNVLPVVCPTVVDGHYLVGISSSNQSFWSVNSDTFYGSGVFGINLKGDVKFIKPMPGSLSSYPVFSANGKYLIKCNVVNSDTVQGTVYSSGLWVIEIDTEGVITRKVKLGMSQANFGEFAVVANDTSIVFAGDAARSKPFIGNGWQVRAIDSLAHPGVYSNDLFVACVDNQGQLKWMYRIDTMSLGSAASSMVLLANGKIIWTPHYYKSGEFLGQKFKVKFPGGRYPMYAEINMDGGAITNFRASQEVGGGTDNGVKLFTDDKFSRVMVASRGDDSTRIVFGITASQWQSSFTKLIYFDANMDFQSQAAIPEYNFSTVNANKTNHLVYPIYFPFGSLGGTLMLDGVTYTNKLGNDILVGNYTTEKFTKLGSVNVLNSGEVLLYPNPAQQQFMVLNSQDNWKTVSVFDVQGRNCGMLQADNGKWNIGHLLPGMYVLQFEGDAGTQARTRLLISR